MGPPSGHDRPGLADPIDQLQMPMEVGPMKRKLRIVRVTVLLAVVALVLSACGGGGGQTSGGGAQTGSGAQLLIWSAPLPAFLICRGFGPSWRRTILILAAPRLIRC